jgi:hypothetical protein
MESSISLTSVLAGAFAAQAIPVAAGIATLSKTNAIAREAGAALVEMIEASLPPADAHQLDIYA